jgi:hypothetical protein
LSIYLYKEPAGSELALTLKMGEAPSEIKYFVEAVDHRELQYVRPYTHEYRTWCKERWRDRNILEVFSNEFKLFNRDYYIYAIENGAITVNNKKVGLDYTIRNGDLLIH